MNDWRSSDNEMPNRALRIIIRKTKSEAPTLAEYVDMGAWRAIREDGSAGGLINTPFEWKLP